MHSSSELVEPVNRCYKINTHVYNKLNLVYNPDNSMLILWNKYQIFVYENLNFDQITLSFTPEFIIHKVLVTNSFMVCLDCNGNIHTTSFKFKHPVSQKRLKCSFQPRQSNVICFLQHDLNHTYTITLESNNFYLVTNSLTIEFSKITSRLLKFNENIVSRQNVRERCLMSFHVVSQNNNVSRIFNLEPEPLNKYHLLVISVDGISVHACIANSRVAQDVISLRNLHTSPILITGMQIIEMDTLKLLLGLKSGTFVILNFEQKHTAENVIHMNTAIEKFIVLKDTILYTDGLTMWKSENTFCDKSITFKQCFVKQTKDFTKVGDQIVAVTYSNLIYQFPYEDDSSYLVIPERDYFPAQKLLNNSELYEAILKEVDKNFKVVEKLRKEYSYVTALALANRKDIRHKIFQFQILAYENYEGASENSSLTLTNEIHEYFEPDLLLLLINITPSRQDQISELLNILLDKLRCHFTFITNNKVLKSTSIILKDVMKDTNVLIPIADSNINEMIVKIKVVADIPGGHDEKTTFNTVISNYETVLSSEHFMKTSGSYRSVIHLKKEEVSIEKILLANVTTLYGGLFKFTVIENVSSPKKTWTFFISLPEGYKEIFKQLEVYFKHLNRHKAQYLWKKLGSPEFLSSSTDISIHLGNTKVKLEIVSEDLVKFALKIECGDIKTALDLRVYLSDIIYSGYKGYTPGKYFVPISFCSVVENIHKGLRDCLNSSTLDHAKIIEIADLYHERILTNLPL